jgi:hypothetical protein
MALVDGKEVVPTAEDLAHVQIDSSLFDQPFPFTRIFPGGPKENHMNVPRQLKVEEF